MSLFKFFYNVYIHVFPVFILDLIPVVLPLPWAKVLLTYAE